MSVLKKVIVLGIGNILMKDDGIGVYAVRALQEASLPEGIDLEIIDGGTAPDLSVFVDGRVNKLIIVDAAMKGGSPGTIYRLGKGDLTASSSYHVSPHHPGIYYSLETLTKIGKEPSSVVIFGIEPGTTDFGLELSPQVESIMPRLIDMILQEATDTSTTGK